jgi:vitamin B12 transporter
VAGVLLRGANRGQTLVLIDGVRIASSSAGATSLEAIPLDQIDRIEILRGPASSLYGADAIGGVVQVFTRRGTGAPSGNVSVGYGSYRTWDVKGGMSGATGPVQYALQAAAKGSNGFSTITNPANFLFNPDPDGYSNRSVSANLGFTAAPGQEFTGQYFQAGSTIQFDGSRTSTTGRSRWPRPGKSPAATPGVVLGVTGCRRAPASSDAGRRRHTAIRRSRPPSGSTRGRMN